MATHCNETQITCFSSRANEVKKKYLYDRENRKVNKRTDSNSSARFFHTQSTRLLNPFGAFRVINGRSLALIIDMNAARGVDASGFRIKPPMIRNVTVHPGGGHRERESRLGMPLITSPICMTHIRA